MDASADATSDIERALARLMRGLIHEIVNPLNSMLMSCELASASLGDDAAVQECLDSIGGSVRRSGAWLGQLGSLAGGDNYRPSQRERPGSAIDRARGLLGSRAAGYDCQLQLVNAPDGEPLALHVMAVAVSVAYVVDGLMASGATRIEVAPIANSGIQIRTDTRPEVGRQLWESAARLAQQVCADHGGHFQQDDSGYAFVLAG